MNTLPLQPVKFGETLATAQAAKNNKAQGIGFGDVLEKSINKVTDRIDEANALSEGLAAGEQGNIHETMIAIEKAGISFRLMTKVQQKAIAAYQEMMRIQL